MPVEKITPISEARRPHWMSRPTRSGKTRSLPVERVVEFVKVFDALFQDDRQRFQIVGIHGQIHAIEKCHIGIECLDLRRDEHDVDPAAILGHQRTDMAKYRYAALADGVELRIE